MMTSSTFLYWNDCTRLTKITVIRTKRKTMQMIQMPYPEVELRVPLETSPDTIMEIITKHFDDIKRHTMNSKFSKPMPKTLPDGEVAEMKRQAKDQLPQRVNHLCEALGITPPITNITSAKKKFGGFVLKGEELRLNLSYRIMKLPDELIDYVLKFLLLLSKAKKRDENFYNMLSEHVPDYYIKNHLIGQYDKELFYT